MDRSEEEVARFEAHRERLRRLAELEEENRGRSRIVLILIGITCFFFAASAVLDFIRTIRCR